MLFWITVALLTAAASLAVLLPLGRVRQQPGAAPNPDRAVYRDQLAERERAEGRIATAEAETARAEIARRLIEADRQSAAALSPRSALFHRRLAAVIALIVLPAMAVGIYLPLGAPELKGQPLQPRLEAPAAQQSLTAMIARIEKHLARQPEDGRGWEVLAPVYMEFGRFEDAKRALANAVRLLGSTAEREAGLGEAITAVAGGVVTAEARQAFERALRADPRAPKPRFFLGLAKQQQGDLAAAVADWRALLADAPADAPWRPVVEQAVAQAEAGDISPAQAPAAPTADEVAAAAALGPAERQAMVDGMVARLAAQLEREPDDVAGWLQLIRAYSVLGRAEEASEAAGKALRALSRPDERRQISSLVANVGLRPTEASRP